jgi:hypothetical protein
MIDLFARCNVFVATTIVATGDYRAPGVTRVKEEAIRERIRTFVQILPWLSGIV